VGEALNIDQKIYNGFNCLLGAANRTRTCDPVITNDVAEDVDECSVPRLSIYLHLPSNAAAMRSATVGVTAGTESGMVVSGTE
jgi:hypothetical protein